MTTAFAFKDSTVAYIQKVYAWLLVGIGLALGAGYWGLTAGSSGTVKVDDVERTVPFSVSLAYNHPLVSALVFLGMALLAGMVRRMPGVNALAYFMFTAFTGIFLGPCVYIAQLKAAHGGTLSANPVRDAAALTIVAFVSLSAYTRISRRDFSYLGGALFTGLLVLIGAMVLGLFFHSTIFELAISSVAVILFSLYILFDTWRIIDDKDQDDAIGHALQLFLDIANIFIHLLRILGVSTKSD